MKSLLLLRFYGRFSCSRHFAGSNWRGNFKGEGKLLSAKNSRSASRLQLYLSDAKIPTETLLLTRDRKIFFSLKLNQLLHKSTSTLAPRLDFFAYFRCDYRSYPVFFCPIFFLFYYALKLSNFFSSLNQLSAYFFPRSTQNHFRFLSGTRSVLIVDHIEKYFRPRQITFNLH